jgi:hypothetical protein
MIAVGVLAGSPQPVEWQADYGKALAATRAGDQPLLVVLDEPKSADARVEPALLREEAAVGQDSGLLRRYHLCHVDVSTRYGKKVARAFKARRFPHVAIIDKSGSVVIFAKSGKMAKNEWNEALRSHQDGTRPMRHVSYKLTGDSDGSSAPVYRNNSYCPSCQRRSM